MMEFSPEYSEYVKHWEARKKQYVIEAGKKYQAQLLIETGTCKGDMVAACRDHFERVYSIELSNYYFETASSRFQGDPRIQLIKGDSAVELLKLLPSLTPKAAIFWLDAHYSGGKTAKENPNPLGAELAAIMNQWTEGLILIDDQNLCGKQIDQWKQTWTGFDYFDNIIRLDIKSSLEGAWYVSDKI